MNYLKLTSWETGNNIWLPEGEIAVIYFDEEFTRIKTKNDKTIKVTQNESYFDDLLMPQLPQPEDYEDNYVPYDDDELPF